MSEKKKRSYSCRDCVRRRTALCDACVADLQPDGDVGKPTYFMRRVVRETEAAYISLAQELMECILRRESLSVARVDEYNCALARGEAVSRECVADSVCVSDTRSPSTSLPEGGLEKVEGREGGAEQRAGAAKKPVGTGAKKKPTGTGAKKPASKKSASCK